MEILFYIMIGLFALDIILGLIFGYIDGKRAALYDYKLSCILQAFEKELDDRVFPEFEDSNEKHKNDN